MIVIKHGEVIEALQKRKEVHSEDIINAMKEWGPRKGR
jgi:hypothetical protein